MGGIGNVALDRDDLARQPIGHAGQIARGLPNKLIARDLEIAEKTVKTHVSSILSKLGLTDRTQAALYAVRRGMVES